MTTQELNVWPFSHENRCMSDRHLRESRFRGFIMNTVPEERMPLAMMLAGNKAFGTCRGTFYQRLGDIVHDAVDETKSVTETANRLDKWYSSVRAMTILLAQLRRDGRDDEYDDLFDALHDRNRLIQDEKIPLEITVPVTILMLEPTTTMKLLELLAELDASEDELLKLFPTLDALALTVPSRALQSAYSDIIVDLPRSFAGSIQLGEKGWTYIRDKNGHRSEAIKVSLPGNALAFMFFGKEQGKVLGMIDRGLQHRVGSWQIDLPAFTVSWRPRFSLCFHEEAVHPEWSRKYPALASKGVSNGYGAFFMYEGMMHLDQKHRYMNKELVNINGDLSYRMRPGAKSRIELLPLVSDEVRFKLE